MKKLTLYRHSEKTQDGNHISFTDGLRLAMATGATITDNISHVFHGPLPRTAETACYLVAGNPNAFSDATQHDPIVGLGDNDLFSEMFPDNVRNLVGKYSVLGAVFQGHGDTVASEFAQRGIDAINEMFDLMENDEIGVGMFHDPTISLAAHFIGLPNARSLKSMESITFIQDDDGNIKAIGINPAGVVEAALVG